MSAIASARLRLFAVAAPGLEGIVATEIAALLGPGGRAAAELQVVPGGVEFVGDLQAIYGANLGLRCASRLLLRRGEVVARDFPALQRGLAALDLAPFLRRGGTVPLLVHASAERCRLYHTVALAESVAEALTRAGYSVSLQKPTTGEAEEPGPSEGAELWLRGVGDRFTLSLDTSGALLHQRGYRGEAGPAPLRETLAAALASLAGYDGSGALCDPMCGSGTLVIEAALRARGRAPGLLRRFAFERWPCFDPRHLAEIVARLQAEEARARQPVPPAPIYASDADPAVLALARRNAERAGVVGAIEFAVADVGSLRLRPAPAAGGLILTNPPYGRRLGDRDLGGLYRKLARLARSAPGWRLALLTSQPALARLALRQPTAIPLKNGGLAVALYLDRRSSGGELATGTMATTGQ